MQRFIFKPKHIKKMQVFDPPHMHKCDIQCFYLYLQPLRAHLTNDEVYFFPVKII